MVENSSASVLKQGVNMSNQSMQIYSTYIYIYTYMYIQILLGILAALILIACSVYHTYVYIYVSMYILYIAPTKKKGCPFCTRQQAFFLSKRCQFRVIMSKWVSLHSSYWIPLYVPPYCLAPKNQTSTSPHVSKQLNPPPRGIFGFLLFGTPVVSHQQFAGPRPEGALLGWLSRDGSGWINGGDQWVISPIHT